MDTILMTLMLSSLLSTAPNLCDDAYLNAAGEPITDTTGRTLPRHCEWRGPDAPTLEANVCCKIGEDDRADCQLANLRGYCPSGARMWCEHGEVDSTTGAVTCMEAFPSACAEGFCIEAPAQPPQEMHPELLCCGPGGCTPVETSDDIDNCEGHFLACDWGMSNADGTVECFE